MRLHQFSVIFAGVILTAAVQSQPPTERRDEPVPTAEQIVAAVGNEREAAAIAASAIALDAVRRFAAPPSNSDVVSLLDWQWREQWVPRQGVGNLTDGRRVTFVRLSATNATEHSERCGRLLLLRRFVRVNDTLTVQFVDYGRCSSSGFELTFRQVDGHWRPEGEPNNGFGGGVSGCGCP
jgi:hypothetical protein